MALIYPNDLNHHAARIALYFTSHRYGVGVVLCVPGAPASMVVASGSVITPRLTSAQKSQAAQLIKNWETAHLAH
jgi:hypothetical protein